MAAEAAKIDYDKLRRRCLRRAQSLENLSAQLKLSQGTVLNALHELQRRGINVRQVDAGWVVDLEPPPIAARDERFHWESDDDGVFRFGLISDQHYGSKFCREDVAEELYDWFASEGITRVYNAGNWIDGEGHDNSIDLLDQCHGMQQQIDYCAAKWPHKPGIHNYYVSGNDHEGWYVKRESVNIGDMLKHARQDLGHDDFTHLGYVEAYIRLTRPDSDVPTRMLVQHPSGGMTSKNISLKAHNLVGALQEGEVPGVYIVGHFHKRGAIQVRSTEFISVPSCKEQDTWMRTKGIDSQIGGAIIELKISKRGGVNEICPRFKMYRDRRHYALGFDPAGDMGPRITV